MKFLLKVAFRESVVPNVSMKIYSRAASLIGATLNTTDVMSCLLAEIAARLVLMTNGATLIIVPTTNTTAATSFSFV